MDLIVRPTDSGEFEVLDGKRRLAAARTRDDIPALWCQVRAACTDAEALQIIIVTQLHRANLDPLAEAALVRRLIDGGMTREACAAELGRPVAWVAKRAALSDLAPVWRDAATRPAWASVGYLEVVARLPQPVQVAISQDYAEAWRQPHSVEDFADEIRERYLHLLKHAPWKLDDLAVLPTAPACTDCPQRSSCQTTLFEVPPGEADRCLDATCWGAKLSAHTANKARVLAAKHPRVLVLTRSNGQPAPANLPEQAVVVPRTHGIEDCRKTDEGAIPALDAETGKHTWVRIESWADAKVRRAVGLDATPAGTTAVRAHERGAPTADQRREAKRINWRLTQAGAALVDAERPDLSRVVRLYAVFCAARQSSLEPQAWADVETMPDDEISDLLWDAVVTRVGYHASIPATALPDLAAIAAIERLATLDPAEQQAKALAEVPEPKRKG